MQYDTEVLLCYEDGSDALWVNTYEDGRRTLNDANTEVELGDGDDLDEEVENWKQSVDWEDNEE